MIVFTYPGQGSQKPGMGVAWREHPSWELVEEASEAASRDVAALLCDTDAEELTRTRNAQLATFVTSMVALDAVTRLGAQAAAHAGHSLGEYSALTAAGVLDFADAVRLVTERGDAMQAAADEREGTMAAVLGLDDEQVDIACHRAGGEVWVANFNAPGQVVIAGVPDDVDRAAAIARELGAKRAMRLPVGGAFHTPLMAPARDRLRKALDQTEFRAPTNPVVANVDAAFHTDAAEWPDLLAAQLCSPVRWRQTLTNLDEAGYTVHVEIGPGTVLTGLAKRTIRGARLVSVSTPADLDGLLDALAHQPSAEGAVVEGEHLFATERLVVSPTAGIFEPTPTCRPGADIAVGDVLGHVAGQEVRSSFAGRLMGVLALEGERVTPSQPIAWLRSTT